MLHIHSSIYFYFRKEWVKRQHIVHSYGKEDEAEDYIEEPEVRRELEQRISNGTIIRFVPQANTSSKPDDIDVVVGGVTKKPCKCGDTTHQRTSHRNCPLNKKQ